MKIQSLPSLFMPILVMAASILTGCITIDPIPGGTPPPEPQIKTPRQLKITKIVVAGFPRFKKDRPIKIGWDAGFRTSAKSRPDLYVVLKDGDNKLYESNVQKDAHYNQAYTFTRKYAITSPGPLPQTMGYLDTFVVDVMDDDVDLFGMNPIDREDKMGYVNIHPSKLYSRDNAKTVVKKIKQNGITLGIHGEWIY